MRSLTNVLITDGVGFIGSNFIRTLLKKDSSFTGRIINLDVLTYAGNAASLSDIESDFGGSAADARYIFIHGNICDKELVAGIFEKYDIDSVVHFAAESPVDRSILGPEVFLQTNILGTFTLLEAAKKRWFHAG